MLKRARRGFTLLELIVVLVVLGIIALIAIPTFNNIIRGSAERTALTTAQSIARSANGIAALEADETWDADLYTATRSDEIEGSENLQIAVSSSVTSGGTATQTGIVWVRATTSGDNNAEYACVWIDETATQNNQAQANVDGDGDCDSASGTVGIAGSAMGSFAQTNPVP